VAGARGSLDDEEPDGGLDLGPGPVSPLHTATRWPLPVSPGVAGVPPIISEPRTSTPLDSDPEESDVPVGPLWSMKYLRHAHRSSSGSIDGNELRWAVSVDDPRTSMYAIEDGDRHCMVARTVGSGADGSTYHLVARVKRLDFEDVRAGWNDAGELWTKAKEFTLCAVVEGTVSNVVRVESYRRFTDVPTDYLPPADLIEFDEPL
jgi:hypothetical protein